MKYGTGKAKEGKWMEKAKKGKDWIWESKWKMQRKKRFGKGKKGNKRGGRKGERRKGRKRKEVLFYQPDRRSYLSRKER